MTIHCNGEEDGDEDQHNDEDDIVLMMMAIFDGHSLQEGMDIGAHSHAFPLSSYPPSQSREKISLCASPPPLF